MVMVAEPGPLPEQPPAVVIATARPEDAVAATPNDAPYMAEAGAAVVIEIVWLAVAASVQSEKEATPLSSAQLATVSTEPVRPWSVQLPSDFHSWRFASAKPLRSPSR